LNPAKSSKAAKNWKTRYSRQASREQQTS